MAHRFVKKFDPAPVRLIPACVYDARDTTLQFLRRMLPEAPPSDWFLRRKIAATQIEEVSDGHLILLSNSYCGHKVRHWLLCVACGNEVNLTYEEIRKNRERSCCFCFPTSVVDLAAFGSTDRLQAFTWWLSNGNAVIAPGQTSLKPTKPIQFLCYVCGESYHTTFTDFANHAGEGNGCPSCHVAIRKRNALK